MRKTSDSFEALFYALISMLLLVVPMALTMMGVALFMDAKQTLQAALTAIIGGYISYIAIKYTMKKMDNA